MEVTKEQLQELKDKEEQTKTLFLKYQGAIEVLESILNAPKVEKPKKQAKTKK